MDIIIYVKTVFYGVWLAIFDTSVLCLASLKNHRINKFANKMRNINLFPLGRIAYVYNLHPCSLIAKIGKAKSSKKINFSNSRSRYNRY